MQKETDERALPRAKIWKPSIVTPPDPMYINMDMRGVLMWIYAFMEYHGEGASCTTVANRMTVKPATGQTWTGAKVMEEYIGFSQMPPIDVFYDAHIALFSEMDKANDEQSFVRLNNLRNGAYDRYDVRIFAEKMSAEGKNNIRFTALGYDTCCVYTVMTVDEQGNEHGSDLMSSLAMFTSDSIGRLAVIWGRKLANTATIKKERANRRGKAYGNGGHNNRPAREREIHHHAKSCDNDRKQG